VPPSRSTFPSSNVADGQRGSADHFSYEGKIFPPPQRGSFFAASFFFRPFFFSYLFFGASRFLVDYLRKRSDSLPQGVIDFSTRSPLGSPFVKRSPKGGWFVGRGAPPPLRGSAMFSCWLLVVGKDLARGVLTPHPCRHRRGTLAVPFLKRFLSGTSCSNRNPLVILLICLGSLDLFPLSSFLCRW